jgi:hypothetical protein
LCSYDVPPPSAGRGTGPGELAVAGPLGGVQRPDRRTTQRQQTKQQAVELAATAARGRRSWRSSIARGPTVCASLRPGRTAQLDIAALRRRLRVMRASRRMRSQKSWARLSWRRRKRASRVRCTARRGGGRRAAARASMDRGYAGPLRALWRRATILRVAMATLPIAAYKTNTVTGPLIAAPGK